MAKKKKKGHTFGSGGLLTGAGFKICVRRLKGKVANAKAVCAKIARRKYGQKALTRAAIAGRKKRRK